MEIKTPPKIHAYAYHICGACYINDSYIMATKPIKFLELHYTMTQFFSHYYMARQIRAFWLVVSWSGFCHTDSFRGNGHKLCIFWLSKAGKFKTSLDRVPYNKLFTNLASSSHTEEYWPSVVFVGTSLRSVSTATTSGQYSAVQPSRSVSKEVIIFSFFSIRTVYISRNCRVV